MIIAVVLFAGPLMMAATTDAQTINACQAAKKKCVSTKMTGLLKCHAKAEAKGIAVDPACLSKCMVKFSDPVNGCFARREAKGGCLTTGDAPALEAKVDAFVDDVVDDLDPFFPNPIPGGNKCAARKKQCVSKKAEHLLACHIKAEKTGILDPACLAKVRAKFIDCFSKLELKSPCLTMGDAAALETKVDTFVDDVVCELDPAGGTCGTPCEHVIFNDVSFADSDWTLQPFLFGSSFPTDGYTTASQDLSKGCPATSRSIFIHVAGAGASIAGSAVIGIHIKTGATYTPSILGMIDSLDYSEDKRFVGNATGQGQATGLALVQSGQVYIYQPWLITGVATSCGTLATANATAAELCRVLPSGSNPTTYGPYVDCAQHPDFSCTGPEIAFGFFRWNSAPPSNPAYETTALIDNWRIDLCKNACP